MLYRFLALFLVAAVTACTMVEDAKPPTIELTNIRMGQPGLLSQQFVMDLRVGNPNDFALPLEGMTFRLDINDQQFAEGFSNETVTVPRLAYATVSVTATASLLGIVRQFMALEGRDTLSYRITGDAYVAGGLGRRTVPYVREGELSLAPPARTPRQAAPGMRMFVPTPGI